MVNPTKSVLLGRRNDPVFERLTGLTGATLPTPLPDLEQACAAL